MKNWFYVIIFMISCFLMASCNMQPSPHSHQFKKIERVEATCIQKGNVEYFKCETCNKYFSDIQGNNEIRLSDTIIDLVEHHYENGSNVCSVCGHINDDIIQTKLDKPEITEVKYDVVYWKEVANAETYTVIVNDDYTYTTRGTSCNLKDVKLSTNERIEECGPVRIKVVANPTEGSKYLASDPCDVYDNYNYIPLYSNLVKNNGYTYPDDLSLQLYTNNGIGYGYNIIEDSYLDPNKISDSNIFNIDKLFTLGTPVSTTKSITDFNSFSYSTIDEYFHCMSTNNSLEYSLKMKPVGSLKLQLSGKSSIDYSEYKYKNTYVYVTERNNGDLKFVNLLNSEYLYNCLSYSFLKDINRESIVTSNMSDEELAIYIYNTYGTHAILGVQLGGTHYSLLTISTNSYSTATQVETLFKVNAQASISKLLSSEMKVSSSLEDDETWNNTETKTIYQTYYYGGSGGILTSMDPSGAQSALNDWDKAVANNPVVKAFSENGSIDIPTILKQFNPNVANAYKEYITQKTDSVYQQLIEEYQIWNPNSLSVEQVLLPMNINNINGKNVLNIDLSKLQALGSFDDVYSPYLVDNKFTIYPTMMGKNIDKVVVDGGIYNLKSRMLINDLQFVFEGNFTNNVDVEFKNIAIKNEGKSLINIAKVTNAQVASHIKNKAKYVNAIIGENSLFHYYLNQNMHFVSNINVDIDVNTLKNESLNTFKYNLPMCNLPGNEFDGWFVDNERLTDNFGVINEAYQYDGEFVNIEPKFSPKKYLITLNHSEGSSSENQFFVVYKDGSYKSDGTKITSIDIPSKIGYTFLGYFGTIGDNKKEYINANGEINSEITIDILENIELIAEWEAKVFTIFLDNSNPLYVKYHDNVYNEEACDTSIKEIIVPSKEGVFFDGYYTEKNGLGKKIIKETGEIVNIGYLINCIEDQTLYAHWLDIPIVSFNQNEGSGGHSTKLYIKYLTGVFSDISCEEEYRVNSIVTPSRIGYTFNGYYYNNEMMIDKNGTIQEELYNYKINITLTAAYTPNVYKISFNTGYENINLEPSYVTYDQPYKELPTPTTDHYQFVNWHLGSSTGEVVNKDIIVKITSDAILWAEWVLTENVIVFKCTETVYYNNTILPDKQVTISCNELFELSSYKANKKGYTFEGWYSDEQLTNLVTTIDKTKEYTYLYPKFNAKSYTITLNPNGGSCTTTSIVVKYDSTIDLPIPTRANHSFCGWAKSAYDEIGEFSYTHKYDGDITLYAIWRKGTGLLSIDNQLIYNSNNVMYVKEFTYEDKNAIK